MKRILCLLAISCLVSSTLFCHQILENQIIEPKEKQARQLPLTLELTIRDNGGSFYFKRPYNIKTAPDGSLFIMDSNHIYKFDGNGKFVKKMVKKGQGPGEATMISNYLAVGNNEILVHEMLSNKIIKLDGSGTLIDEKRLKSGMYPTLFHQDNEQFYLLNEKLEYTLKGGTVTDVDQQILTVSKKDYSLKEIFSFKIKKFVFKIKTAFSIVRITPFLTTGAGGNRFFISHTPEYGIKLIDLDSKQILLEFRRPYKRVKVTNKNKKYVIRGSFVIDGKKQKSPLPEYLNDIQSIHFSRGKLWVFTSTVDPVKGVLVDVFDNKGKYHNSFYLKFRNDDAHHKLEQNLITVVDNVIYLVEQDEEENWVIMKYLMPSS